MLKSACSSFCQKSTTESFCCNADKCMPSARRCVDEGNKEEEKGVDDVTVIETRGDELAQAGNGAGELAPLCSDH